MKIIINYDRESFFTLEQWSAIQLLELSEAQVIDFALSNWTVLLHGQVHEAYERVVDELYEAIATRHGDSDHGIRLQHLLGEYADQLTELMRHVTARLHYALANIPHEVNQMGFNTDDYYYLKVERIDLPGNFVVLTTDVIDA